jgi:hypothetical protein
MIIGASPETVYQIITLAEAMYGKYALKRIFNSAHIPAVEHTLLPARIPSSLKAAVEPEKRVLPAPLKDTTAWWNLPRKTVCSGRAFCSTCCSKHDKPDRIRHLRQISFNYATAGFRPWFSFIIHTRKLALRK